MIYTIEFDSTGKAFCASAYTDKPAALVDNEVECTQEQYASYQQYALVDGAIVAASSDVVAEVLGSAIRSRRDTLIANSDWVVRRQADQVAAGTTASLSDAEYAAWLTYRQALRDVTKQSTFPASVTWPSSPT